MIKKKSVRKSLRSSASILGLAAGAVGWSGLSTAESEDSQVQTLLLPEHYHLSDDGLVTFSLQTGEQLSLNPDQYVILQDGLLLITDEIAQASMQSLPVMGSIRAQLTSELQPVRSPDGSVVQASDASPLWSGDGPAPRLFEEVDIQRFELAQNSSETQTQSEANLGQAAGAAAGGLSIAGLSLFSSIPGTKSEQPTEEEEPSAPAPAPAPEFLSDAMFQALTPANARVFTGSAGDSYIGYTAADPTATQDPLFIAGAYAGNSATFDMTAGGDNLLLALGLAGAAGGSFNYTGGPGKDVLTFDSGLANQGSAVINGGNGHNTLTAGNGAAQSGSFSYTGGSGKDDIALGHGAGGLGGTVTLNVGNGDNTLNVLTQAGKSSGAFSYTGGSGSDVLTFGTQLAQNGGTVQLDLGNDSSYDAIKFEGTVALSAASESKYVQIMNYDVTNDAMTVYSAPITANDFRLDGNDIHWERPNDIYITFVGLGPSAANIAISAITGTITVA